MSPFKKQNCYAGKTITYITNLNWRSYLYIHIILFCYIDLPIMLFYVHVAWLMIGQPKQAKCLSGFTDTLRGKDLMEINTLPYGISTTWEWHTKGCSDSHVKFCSRIQQFPDFLSGFNIHHKSQKFSH